MKLIIHDLPPEQFAKLYPWDDPDITVVSDDGGIRPCIGCFGCWVKTPGRCVIHDGYEDMGRLIGSCSELEIISRCAYGGFSPFVKNVLDRSISYIHPYFTDRNGEMHHRSRYDNRLRMSVLFYGEDISPEVRETAQKLVSANAVNLNVASDSVRFFRRAEELEEVCK